MRDLLLKGTLQKRAKKQVIQTTDSEKTFNLVKKGYIKRYHILNTGAINIQVIYGPGDFFSVTQAYKILFGKDINDGPEAYYYEAMTDTEIYSIEIESLLEHAQSTPRLYRDMLMITGDRLRSTLHGLENVGLRSSYNRVAHELHFLAEKFGEPSKIGGVRICAPLTHQDLADILSVTRETVSICISDLRKAGLIKTNRYIVVPNMKRLQEEAHA